MKLLDALGWLVFDMPHRVRVAWCELTGGHDNDLHMAKQRGEVSHVALHCLRCGKRTRWYATSIRNHGL